MGFNFVNAAVKAGHRVVAVCSSQNFPETENVEVLRLDLADSNAVQRAVLDVFPEAVVNCAAIASPSEVDAKPELANKLNAELPGILATLAHHVSARFVHLSTDMVFDGTRAPYKNTDVPMPCTLYGTTKLIGEKKVLEAAAKTSVVLRISHVSGNSLSKRRSLHEKLLRTWACGEKARCRTDEIKMPLSASLLADLLVEICERPSLSGIYHYAGLEPVSRYDMAARIASYFGLDPSGFVEPVTGGGLVDLRMDISSLAARVKTRSCMFNELLPEMLVPDDLKDWLKSKSGRLPVMRYKL